MINGIHHISLVVRDLKKMVSFYLGALGFQEVTAMEWADSEQIDSIVGIKGSAAKMQMVRLGNLIVEMFQYISPVGERSDLPEPWRLGYTHFCLDVTDIDAEYERLSAAGMTFHAPPPARGGIDVRALYGRDPEGNIIEIQELFSKESPFYFSVLHERRVF